MNRKNKKGFTLIEVLVVVIIMGILTAIVLPKYQTAIAKSEFSTLKLETATLAQAVNYYRHVNNQEPTSFNDLDVSFSLSETHNEGVNIVGSLSSGGTCFIINSVSPKQVGCFLANQKMRFYYNTDALKPHSCITLSNYKTGIKVCEQETNKTQYGGASCGVDFGNGPYVEPCNQYFYN